MERLLARFNETVNLAVREGDNVVIVEVLQGARGLKKINEVGQRDPWHASALGKAILAWMPSPERRALLQRHKRPRLTANTIVSLDELERDLNASRQRGYTLDLEEAEDDVTCVGSAVTGVNGRPIFALSVSFLTHRLEADDIDLAAEAITAAASQLEEMLGRGGAR